MDRSSRAHLLLLVCVAALLLVGAAWSGDRQTSSPAPSLQVTTNSTSTPIPLADEPYTNPLLGFSLRPPAGWRVSETGQRDPLVSIRDLDGPDFVAIQVSVFRLDRPTPIQDWLMGEVALYGGGSIDILEDSPAELGPGTYGHKTLFDWSRATGVAIKEQWTGVVRKRQGFAIRAFCHSPGSLDQASPRSLTHPRAR